MEQIRVTCEGAHEVYYTDLVPYQGSLKELSQANYQKLKASILRDGFCAPVFVWNHDDKYYTLDGHQRIRALTAMEKEGYEIPTIPVVWVEAANKAEAKRKILALTSQYGEITGQGLYEFMHEAEMGMEDLDAFRFPEISLDDFKAEYFEQPQEGLTDDDEVPEPSEDPYVKLGDVWKLGEHTVVCGDSLEARWPEGHALMVTDPPYGVDYDPNWRPQAMPEKFGPSGLKGTGRVANDEDYNALAALRKHGGHTAYVWHADKQGPELARVMAEEGFEIRAQIVWIKDQPAVSRGHYNWGHEPCYYFARGSTDWQGDAKQRTTWEIPRSDRGQEDTNTVHGTQKPVECMARPIRNHRGDVYDPFLGSGTTLIACEKLGRKCYGIEIEPKYVQVAIERWQNFTGKTAQRVDKIKL